MYMQETLNNVKRKVDVLSEDCKSDKNRDKEIIHKIDDIKSLLLTENKARNMDQQNLEHMDQQNLKHMVEDAVDSIRKRECFADSITASTLPENAKPLHRWLINRYGHKPRNVKTALCKTSTPCPFFNQVDTSNPMDENMCALWLVTWIKQDTNNTAENLIYFLKLVDDIFAEEEQKTKVPVFDSCRKTLSKWRRSFVTKTPKD